MLKDMDQQGRSDDSTFSCPHCGKDIMTSKAGSDMGEDHQNQTKNKVVKQPFTGPRNPNAATMPMGQLKNKISSVPGMPQNPMVPPNLNSY